MFVTDDLFYSRMHKTASTSVCKWLLMNYGGQNHWIHPVTGEYYMGHIHVRYLPEELFEGRVIFSTVRDPLMWYVSWYLNMVESRHSEAVRGYLSRWVKSADVGWSHFKQVLHGATHPSYVVFDRIISEWEVGRPMWGQAMSGCGVWSWHTREFIGRSQYLVDVAYLNCGLNMMMKSMGQTALIPAPRLNVRVERSEGDYPSDRLQWYDEDMLRWVEEADGTLALELDMDISTGIMSRPCVRRDYV